METKLTAETKQENSEPSTENVETPLNDVSTSQSSEEASKENAIPIQCGDSIDNDNFLMTFDSVELLSEYSYETGGNSTMSLYIEDGYKVVIVKGYFENKSTSAISPGSSFALSAVVNNTYVVDGFDVYIQFFRDKFFEIDAYTDLDYILYIQIPEKLADMFETVTFTLGFNNDLSSPSYIQNNDGTLTTETDNLYEFTSGLSSNDVSSDTSNLPSVGANADTGSTEKNKTAISIGETIVTENYDFTLTNVELTYEVLPSDTSSVFTSYPADSGKVYINVMADIKNTMKRDIRVGELFTASALYDNKYSYNGFTVVNEGDSFNWVDSYTAALPLETCKAHNLIECPAEVDTSGKPIVVTLLLGDTSYEYVFR